MNNMMISSLRAKQAVFIILTAMTFVNCVRNGNSGDAKLDPGLPMGPATPVLAALEHVGCQIQLVSPKLGDTVDFSLSAVRDFVFTADGAECQPPFSIWFAGNPATGSIEDSRAKEPALYQLFASQNILLYLLTPDVAKSKIARFTLNDLSDLKTSDGIYSWVVQDKNGTHPSSGWFRTRRDPAPSSQ